MVLNQKLKKLSISVSGPAAYFRNCHEDFFKNFIGYRGREVHTTDLSSECGVQLSDGDMAVCYFAHLQIFDVSVLTRASSR